MPRKLVRKLAAMSFGTFAVYLISQLPTKKKRKAMRYRRIMNQYDAMAADPEFMRDMGALNRDLDGCVGDGLEAVAVA